MQRLVLLMALLAVAPANAAAKTEKATPPQRPSDANDKSSEILLIGDSLMRVGLAPVLRKALVRDLHETVTLYAKSSTGLARPDAFDWPVEAAALLDGRHFELIIISLGSNDCQDLTTTDSGGEDAAKRRIAYDTPAWDTEYRGRVKHFAGQLCDGASQVLWLELPSMRNAKFNGRITKLNTLLAAVLKDAGCARFVPIAARVADAKGEYTDFLMRRNKRIRIREDDGIHLTQHGGQLVTDAILEQLKPNSSSAKTLIKP